MKTSVLTLALALVLSACSKQEAPVAPGAPTAPSAPVAATVSAYDSVVSRGKGFTVGAMMSAQTVYVIFEPQCPHCGHLWQASLPLHNQVRFVWIPIAFNAGKSVAQAAALLTASNPVEAMTAHEQSLLMGQGGIAEASSVSDEVAKSIRENTQLLNSLGVDSVPFLISKNRKTGEVVSNNGAMETGALATLLGLN